MQSPAVTHATIAYECGGTGTAGAPVARLFVGGTQLTDDLRAVLYKRLRFGASLCLFLYLFFVAIWAFNVGYDFSRYTLVDGVYFVLIYQAFLGEVVACAILWTKRDLSLRRLRVLELVVVGLPVAHQIFYDGWPLFGAHVFLQHLEGGAGAHNTSRAHVFTWFVIIVAYGVLIPNTWRRSAVILSALSLLAFGINFGAAVRDGVLGRPFVVKHLIEVVVWLGFGTAFAVYNAFRIDVLRATAAASRQLGQYRLTEQLGAGGMGEVYRAEHALLRRPCAIKLIRPDRARDPSALARFEREVQATAALAHPHIVRIHDYGRADDGTFYCVMEYLPGTTLDDLVKRHGPLTPDRAVFLLRQLCSALAEAHAAGLTHRDVKPGNVIVRDAGRQADFATLLDFGLVLDRAAGDDKLTRDGTVAGTPAYMSPEQAAGDPVDHRADVYAVGAVGYFLLSGRTPFASGSAMRTIAALLTEAPKPLDGAPPELARVLMRCLAKAPGDRFGSADELDVALARCAGAGWSHQQAAKWWAGRHGPEPRPGPETATFAAPGDSPGPTGASSPESDNVRGR